MMKPILATMLSVSGPVLTDSEKRILETYNPLGITLFKRNIETLSQVATLTQSVREVIGRENVLIGVDQEGGRVCRFMPPLAPDFVSQYSIGTLSGQEQRELSSLQAKLIASVLKPCGINLNYAPCLDVCYEQTAPVLKSRCFSENEKVVANLGHVLIDSYKKAGIIPCMKHLPGHGRVVVDPHLHLPILNESVLELEKDFYPFQKNASACPMGMTAHIVVSGIDSQYPITQSKRGIDILIRQKIGFDGFLISDAIDMHALKGSLKERTQLSLEAGCDAVCYCMGETIGLFEVCQSAKPLTEKALERLNRCFSVVERDVVISDNDFVRYQELTQNIQTLDTDYDAVEVLHQLKHK